MLEIMVFLKKNAKFMPSVEEVVFEMKRKKQAAKDAKRAAAKATKAASSSSSSSAGASGGGWADADMAEDAEGDETDDEADLPDFDSSPSLSDGDVASLLSSIADSRSDVSQTRKRRAIFLASSLSSSGSRVTDFCFCFFISKCARAM